VNDFKMAIGWLYRLGVRKVRFTGGEPTLHTDLPALITYTKTLNHQIKTAITTNGLLMPRLAPALSKAGLDSVNISLDTLDTLKFRTITGTDGLSQVLKGIDAAMRHIGEVKLNCVVMMGINDDEASEMIRYADDLGIDIRFIEYMPTRLNADEMGAFLSNDVLRQRLPFNLRPVPTEAAGAARYFVSSALRIRVGFISPVSHSFCSTCDRLRLSAEGVLYGCLFSSQGINLFDLLNENTHEAQVALEQLLANKSYRGCAAALADRSHLPSFIHIGG
jgi:cyclic pyranopterin phosphate synthase